MTTKILAPTIRVEVKQDREIRFLWLKYVRGFNPGVHCARSLVGPYSKLFAYSRGYVPVQTITGQLDEAFGPWLYLCAVTKRWEWNVHIAGQFELGSRATHDDERIKVEIDNFRRLPIDAKFTPAAAPEFATCRNWQFGWQALSEKPRKRRTIFCPNCQSKKVAKILYGYPAMTDDLQLEIQTGKTVLGGCVIGKNDPCWHCTDCQHEWTDKISLELMGDDE